MNARLATCTSMQNSSEPSITLLDFTAKWCGPCRVMEPTLASIAKEFGDRVRIVPIDVDDQQTLAQQYNVRSMPTFVLVRDGREVGRAVGSRPRAHLVGMIDRALAGDVAIASP
jgi:thioredoxin 1